MLDAIFLICPTFASVSASSSSHIDSRCDIRQWLELKRLLRFASLHRPLLASCNKEAGCLISWTSIKWHQPKDAENAEMASAEAVEPPDSWDTGMRIEERKESERAIKAITEQSYSHGTCSRVMVPQAARRYLSSTLM